MDIQYLKKAAIYFVSLVVAVFAVIYVTHHLFNGFETEIETFMAQKSTERETLSLDAYIFRNETVLYSGDDGVVNYLYSDGDKVGSGYTVARIYGGNSSAIQQNIINIDNKIAVLESSEVSSNLIGSDTARLDAEINSLYYLIREKAESGDYNYVVHKKNELLTLLNKRQMIVESVSGYSDRIAELEAEKQRYTESLEDIDSEIISPMSGWLYLDVDGYENLFSAENIDAVSVEMMNKLENSEPEDDVFDNENGHAVCKLVTGYDWYIACRTSKDSLKNFSQNRKYTVVFPYSEDTEIKMTLYRIVSAKDSEDAILIFSTDIMPAGFNYLRKQTVEIVETDYSGYRIPTSSVRMVEGVQGVYVLDGRKVKFKEIVPLLEKDGYFIVEEKDSSDEGQAGRLELYDKVIVQGKGLYDGKIIN